MFRGRNNKKRVPELSAEISHFDPKSPDRKCHLSGEGPETRQISISGVKCKLPLALYDIHSHLTRITSISQPMHKSLHLRYIVGIQRSKSIPDGIYVLPQSWLVHWLESNIVGTLHRIVVNNHLDRIAVHPSQSTNVTVGHHTRSTESSHCANSDREPKRLGHQDHLNSLRIASMKWLHFVIISVMIFSRLVLLRRGKKPNEIILMWWIDMYKMRSWHARCLNDGTWLLIQLSAPMNHGRWPTISWTKVTLWCQWSK